MGEVGGKVSCGHFWKHRKFILNMPSYLDIVCQNCLRRNDTVYDQSLRRHKIENRRLKLLQSHTSSFTICQYKTEKSNFLKSREWSLTHPKRLCEWFGCRVFKASLIFLNRVLMPPRQQMVILDTKIN